MTKNDKLADRVHKVAGRMFDDDMRDASLRDYMAHHTNAANADHWNTTDIRFVGETIGFRRAGVWSLDVMQEIRSEYARIARAYFDAAMRDRIEGLVTLAGKALHDVRLWNGYTVECEGERGVRVVLGEATNDSDDVAQELRHRVADTRIVGNALARAGFIAVEAGTDNDGRCWSTWTCAASWCRL